MTDNDVLLDGRRTWDNVSDKYYISRFIDKTLGTQPADVCIVIISTLKGIINLVKTDYRDSTMVDIYIMIGQVESRFEGWWWWGEGDGNWISLSLAKNSSE